MTRKRRRLLTVVAGMSCLGIAAALMLNAYGDGLPGHVTRECPIVPAKEPERRGRGDHTQRIQSSESAGEGSNEH